MKYIKTFEDSKMKIVNSKDLKDGWSVDTSPSKTSDKNLDMQLGQKVLELLEEDFQLKVSFGAGKYCTDQHILLDDEKDFYEYRIHFDTQMTFEDWVEYKYDSMEYALEEKTEEELHKEYSEADIENSQNDQTEFSVFLPKNKANITYGLADASKYLILLNKYLPDVLKGNFDSDTHDYESFKGVGQFLTEKNIHITNERLGDVPNIIHRLYKDAKFVRMLMELIGDRETESLFKNWLKLL